MPTKTTSDEREKGERRERLREREETGGLALDSVMGGIPNCYTD